MQVKITNMMNQGLPILLKNAKGQGQSWILPARGIRIIDAVEQHQDLFDKRERGYIRLEDLPLSK